MQGWKLGIVVNVIDKVELVEIVLVVVAHSNHLDWVIPCALVHGKCGRLGWMVRLHPAAKP
jgi:hypothetical protein